MADRYNLDHLTISNLKEIRGFKSPRTTPRGSQLARDHEKHGAHLLSSLNKALEDADKSRSVDAGEQTTAGAYVEFESSPRVALPKSIEMRSKGVREGAARIDATDVEKIVVYLPDSARDAFVERFRAYAEGQLTEKGNVRYAALANPIETVRAAVFESFWTDPNPLPTPSKPIWWEVWCWPEWVDRIRSTALRLGSQVANSDQFLRFPESIVVPIYGTQSHLENLIFGTGGIAELRRATDDPSFFSCTAREEQHAWTEDLAERIEWPGINVPAVCLLDTGVNRSHPLIEPALAPTDAQALDGNWGAEDHELNGHGTGMAGLALHGDLTHLLASTTAVALAHRLESVKILPPSSFPATDPGSYGIITQSAVASAEIANPGRQRVYCMAVSNRNVSGAHASSWSAAIDQAAAGSMVGETIGDSHDRERNRRLFAVSAGNILDHISAEELNKQDLFESEDPAQSWNALSVGGYTNKADIAEPELSHYQPLSKVGELSPYSRTSVLWPQGKSPYKPDIVMEAGNRAISPAGSEVVSGIDSLSVLTTGSDVDNRPLDTFWATSAATAQASRLIARLMAEHPELWPETIRALVIHSAEWTRPMLEEMSSQSRMRERYRLLRKYGYGVPNFERASKSANDDLALISQAEIQPFIRSGGVRFGDAHYYRLPWPQSLFEELDNTPIQLKATLSYFVDPNPGSVASNDPQRYQSYGLRFDLKRSRESQRDFRQRVNAEERPDQYQIPTMPDSGWYFGSQSISAG